MLEIHKNIKHKTKPARTQRVKAMKRWSKHEIKSKAAIIKENVLKRLGEIVEHPSNLFTAVSQGVYNSYNC